MKIFLTGATGFIGGKIIERLAPEHELHALVRTPAKARHLEEKGVLLQAGDLEDRGALEAGMEGCQAVIHGAAHYEIGPVNQEAMTRANVTGTKNVLEVAQKVGIDRIVHISSVAAKGDTGGVIADEGWEHCQVFPCHYERTKFEAHQLVNRYRKEGLPVRVVLPGTVYGPGDPSSFGQYIRDFVSRQLPARFGEETVMSLVHVEDVADGVVRVLFNGKPAEDYLLAGFPHSFAELNAMITDLTGIQGPRFRLPAAIAHAYAAVSETVGHVLGQKVLVTREGIAMVDSLCYAFDSSRAIQELGWCPRTLEEGLITTLESLGVAATKREAA
jgi:dihydroflavonol-4-reductase